MMRGPPVWLLKKHTKVASIKHFGFGEVELVVCLVLVVSLSPRDLYPLIGGSRSDIFILLCQDVPSTSHSPYSVRSRRLWGPVERAELIHAGFCTAHCILY